MEDMMGGGMDDLGDAMEGIQGMAQDAAGAIPEGFTVRKPPPDIPAFLPQEIQDALRGNMGGGDVAGEVTGLPDLSAVTPGQLPVTDLDLQREGPPTPEDILQGIMEGGEASFDPQRESIERAMQGQLARLAEQMAAMGMGTSGVEAALGGEIAMDAAQLEAEQFQEWYQQQVENKMAAAGMLMQDDWKKMDLDHQEAMAKLMFELDRKRELGDQWESGMGDADIRILMALLTNPDLSPQGQQTLNNYMRELLGDEDFEMMMRGGAAARTGRTGAAYGSETI
jgi:hypothetical protein